MTDFYILSKSKQYVIAQNDNSIWHYYPAIVLMLLKYS